MNIPDLIEPLVGWRVWRVRPAGADLTLWSLYAPKEWPQHAATGMTPCDYSGATTPCPPEECDDRHSCGLHASKTFDGAMRYLPDRLRRRRFTPIHVMPATQLVYGQVAVWGEVEEAELSYRAQWAYPHRIIVPVGFMCAGQDAASAAQTLRDGYGVTVELARYAEELSAA